MIETSISIFVWPLRPFHLCFAQMHQGWVQKGTWLMLSLHFSFSLTPNVFIWSLLSKRHLDFIALSIFVDKLQSCYRNGLDGGCDMYYFTGFFFNLRIVAFMCREYLYLIVNISRWFLMGISFTMILSFQH